MEWYPDTHFDNAIETFNERFSWFAHRRFCHIEFVSPDFLTYGRLFWGF